MSPKRTTKKRNPGKSVPHRKMVKSASKRKTVSLDVGKANTRALMKIKDPVLKKLKEYKNLVLLSEGHYQPKINQIRSDLDDAFKQQPELIELIRAETKDANIRIILENAWGTPSNLPMYNILIKPKTIKARSLPLPDIKFKAAPHSADNLPQYINKDLRNLTENITQMKKQHKHGFTPKQNKSHYLVLKNNWTDAPQVIAKTRNTSDA